MFLLYLALYSIDVSEIFLLFTILNNNTAFLLREKNARNIYLLVLFPRLTLSNPASPLPITIKTPPRSEDPC